MQIFTLNSNLKSYLENEKQSQQNLAFIPTMGALHKGHISLIELAKTLSPVTLCSIYVNPRQFNDQQDLEKYPRTLEKDCRMLEASGCDIVYVPSDDEIYPDKINTEVQLQLGNLDQVMEGRFRPGHFMGMLTVVKRLLDIVSPQYLIMGQKDFQQFTLVNQLIKQYNLSVKLVVGSTLRDTDGLALSSRNQRLNRNERLQAMAIYQSLLKMSYEFNTKSINQLERETMQFLEDAGLKPEYVEIIDGDTLERPRHDANPRCIVACIAAWAGNVRLIDNLLLKGSLV